MLPLIMHIPLPHADQLIHLTDPVHESIPLPRLHRCSGRQFPKNADMKFFMPICYLREHCVASIAQSSFLVETFTA